MTRSIYNKVFTLDKLHLQWKDFWRDSKSQSSAGIDAITPFLFRANANKNIIGLYHDLRGEYRFSPLRPFPIEKSNGKKRIICIPTVRDRIVQRVLVDHLYSKAEKLGIINSASYGFVRSKEGNPRGVAAARDKAVNLRKQYPWAYKSDITSFFDNIKRDKVINSTISSLRSPSLRNILTSAVNCEIDQSDAALSRVGRESGIIVGRGIRQGMPLAPLLSNVVLRDFDNMMLRRGYNLVRYADDFIVLAKNEQECRDIDNYARELLSKVDLNLPQIDELGKTSIASPLQGIDFLGLSLEPDNSNSYKLILTKKQMDRISSEMANFKDVDRLVKEKVYLSDVVRKMDLSAGGFRAAYKCADNYRDLDSILSDISHRNMREIFERAFCPSAVNALRRQHKIFFGIERPVAIHRR